MKKAFEAEGIWKSLLVLDGSKKPLGSKQEAPIYKAWK